ncbi:MAG: hypothetical protein COV31_00120 [Candidatus Yanofskybacteria bacterium CG10_big_fil_rev_8_21_14_0_10_46_23]|uniref:Capsular polysaccharide assembling protein CapF C-terminal domain-containing protein n=1 Tax=Candidatus Yanofskybacteria bacterium CG10_big_fil_rev_8_21_14_0_10_46_23 TaxID=1975098 RepID=A0A2H0R535_9BACT|nr:MAG: hypothetical protein COV31_00120 [Candidatus Yanofskybacteria bacterium CG10_big_fil_rev_8_21_14_0_10_46_23]
MFNKPYELVRLVDHPDHRGNLFEILRFKDQGVPGDGQIYCFTIFPGVRRGDHYHILKREWASCVAGKVFVILEDKFGNKEKILLDAKEPSVVYFHPYTSHAFLNAGDAVATVVSYSSKQLETPDLDTFKKFIEI